MKPDQKAILEMSLYVPAILAVAVALIICPPMLVPILVNSVFFAATLKKNLVSRRVFSGVNVIACVFFSEGLSLVEILLLASWFFCFLLVFTNKLWPHLLILLSAYLVVSRLLVKINVVFKARFKGLVSQSSIGAIVIIYAVLLILDRKFVFEFLLLLAIALFAGIFALQILINSVHNVTSGRFQIHNHVPLWVFAAVLWAILFFGVMNVSALGKYHLFVDDVCYELKSSKRATINSFGFRGPEIDEEKPENTWRIMVFGDSATYGWLVSERYTYSRLLEKKLRHIEGDLNIEVINAGVPASNVILTTARLEKRLDRFAPDLIILVTGANDIRLFREGLFQERLERFVKIAEKNGKPLIICSYPFSHREDVYTRINLEIERIAIENNLGFIDLYGKLAGRKTLFFPDGHPSVKGHWFIADTIYKYIEKKEENRLIPLASYPGK